MTDLRVLVFGFNLRAITLAIILTSCFGKTRKRLAERLQLGRKGLEHRKKDVEEVVTQAILELGSEPTADVPLPHWATPQDEEQRLMVFLVTFSSTLNERDANIGADAALPRDPSDMTKEDIQKAMIDVLSNPPGVAARGGRPRQNGVCKPLLMVTVEEPHESRPGKMHKHVVLKLSSPSRFLSYKTALREKHALASHWSCHTTLS